jgi:hypothetical protein
MNRPKLKLVDFPGSTEQLLPWLGDAAGLWGRLAVQTISTGEAMSAASFARTAAGYAIAYQKLSEMRES